MNTMTLPPPGVKHQGLIAVTGLPGLPVTFIGGSQDGPTVLIVSGVHGAEYAAILTVLELARELQPSEVRGRLLMVHPVNPQGFQRRQATVLPEDGRNINGLFYHDGYKGPASIVAGIITGLQSISNFYLDLHTADLYEETGPLACYPATGDESVTLASRQAALMVEASAMIKSTLAGAGITEAAKRGLPSLLIKRGGPGGSCRRPEVNLYKKDVVNVLRHWGALTGTARPPQPPPAEVDPLYLRSTRTGLWQTDVAMGQEVVAGQPLGLITDFFGQTLDVFTAAKNGRVLYGLQGLSTNAGDILLVY